MRSQENRPEWSGLPVCPAPQIILGRRSVRPHVAEPLVPVWRLHRSRGAYHAFQN